MARTDHGNPAVPGRQSTRLGSRSGAAAVELSSRQLEIELPHGGAASRLASASSSRQSYEPRTRTPNARRATEEILAGEGQAPSYGQRGYGVTTPSDISGQKLTWTQSGLPIRPSNRALLRPPSLPVPDLHLLPPSPTPLPLPTPPPRQGIVHCFTTCRTALAGCGDHTRIADALMQLSTQRSCPARWPCAPMG